MKKSGCRKMKMKKNAKSNERPVLREFQCVSKTNSIFRFYIITLVIANNVIQFGNKQFKHYAPKLFFMIDLKNFFLRNGKFGIEIHHKYFRDIYLLRQRDSPCCSRLLS